MHHGCSAAPAAFRACRGRQTHDPGARPAQIRERRDPRRTTRFPGPESREGRKLNRTKFFAENTFKELDIGEDFGINGVIGFLLSGCSSGNTKYRYRKAIFPRWTAPGRRIWLRRRAKRIDLPVLLLFDLDPRWNPGERQAVLQEVSRLGSALAEVGHAVTFLPLSDTQLAQRLIEYAPEDYIVFNWCEAIPGIAHSEPLVPQILDSLGFVFTGANAAALELCEDKHRVKRRLLKSGIPTPQWRMVDSPRCEEWNCFPAIVKAAYQHCSEGITPDSVVMSRENLRERIACVLDTYNEPALVEDFIDGREFHVSLWGNGQIQMLPPVEMDFSAFSDIHDRLCTYDAKFVPDSKHYKEIKTLLPSPLDGKARRGLKNVAAAAFKAVGCRDYARIDIRLRDGVFYVLDVNPNADISADASMACAAELGGYSYGEMGSRLVKLAARRHPLLGEAAAGCHTLSLTGS